MITLASVFIPEVQGFEIPAFFLVDPVSENEKCCGQDTQSGEWRRLHNKELDILCTFFIKFNQSGYSTLKRGNKICIKNLSYACK
jgi:hypothetical protein